MAAFKDKKNGSWYVQFRYTDWRGERQQKLKRGFATKKEAQAWEREFLMQKQADVNMSFESFVALYEKDVKPKLKLNTWLSKEHIIRTKILPYFKKRKLSEITARDVIDWQNEIRQHTKSSGESYSPDYLKNVHTQLSCIFNHAIKYYGLQINPAAKAGNMGSEQPKEMLFWTKEEFLKFIDAMMDKPMLYYAFEILYWCGIREGELLALTPADFDFEKKTLRINKSYQRLQGKDVITTPKTKKSNRVIQMPDFLCDEMQELGHDPSAEEIAAEMGMPVDKVREILKIAQEPVSLETPIGEEEDSHLGDFIPDEDASEPSEAASFSLLKEQLMEVLDTLTPREKKVLELRFGIVDGRTRTLEEVGKEFNVTRERIRQIEAKALRKLRHPSRSKKLRDFLN